MVEQQVHQNDVRILLEGAEDGNADAVCHALDLGVDVNSVNTVGSSALLLASIKGHCFIADILIKRGADVNLVNPQGWSPLHGACYFGHVGVVGLLLKHSADINALNDLNRAPGSEYDTTVRLNVRQVIIGMLEQPALLARTLSTPQNSASNSSYQSTRSKSEASNGAASLDSFRSTTPLDKSNSTKHEKSSAPLSNAYGLDKSNSTKHEKSSKPFTNAYVLDKSKSTKHEKSYSSGNILAPVSCSEPDVIFRPSEKKKRCSCCVIS